MKICSKCKLSKEEHEFHARRYASGAMGLQSFCKSCSSSTRNSYYKKNTVKEKAYDRNRKKKIKEFLWDLKRKPCADCGKSFHPICMDFDHRENKKFEISDGIVNGFSKKKLLEEIKKCDLVCACCHRLRTFERSCKFDKNAQVGELADPLDK